MATQLQIVNDVLGELRETTVSTVNANDYSVLIGRFVNRAKETLEDMWFWTVNEQEFDTTILGDSSTREYNLSSTNDRSFMVRNMDDLEPMAYDVTSNENSQLYDIPLKELRRWRNTFRGTPDALAQPIRFAIKPDSGGRSYSIELEQASSTERTWRTYWYAPQSELAVDGTDDSTEVLLPKRPILLMALYYAQYERGEAQPGGIEEQRAHRAAAAAMEIDMQVHKKSDQKDMTNLEMLRNDLISGAAW